MWVQPDLGSGFCAVMVGQGQLGNEQMSSETSGTLSAISEVLFFTRERYWGLFLEEVKEQNPQVSLGYLPSFSPCYELYSSRAFHAMSFPCTSEDTTGVLVRAHPLYTGHTGLWVFRMGLWCSVNTQRRQGWGERGVMGTFWAMRLHMKMCPFGPCDLGQSDWHSWAISGAGGAWGASSHGKP